MRSAEAEDRRRGRYADDAGSAFRATAKPANRYRKLHKALDADVKTGVGLSLAAIANG